MESKASDARLASMLALAQVALSSTKGDPVEVQNQVFDQLLASFDAFPDLSNDPVTRQKLRGVLLPPPGETVDYEKLLQNVEDEFFPILAVKCALISFKSQAVPLSMKNFDNFHRRYGNIIIDTFDRK